MTRLTKSKGLLKGPLIVEDLDKTTGTADEVKYTMKEQTQSELLAASSDINKTEAKRT